MTVLLVLLAAIVVLGGPRTVAAGLRRRAKGDPAK